MKLFIKDSPEDLFCRGFRQAEVLARTGTDIGHHGAKLHATCDNVDKKEYCVEFVRRNCNPSDVDTLLDRYGALALDKPGFLAGCGLAPTMRVGMSRICAALGLGDKYMAMARKVAEAGYAKREATMLQKYGYASSFESPELAAKARETMKKKYGADHPMHVDAIKDKQRNTMTVQYGAPFSLQSDALKDRIQQTMVDRYGSALPGGSPEIRSRAIETMLDRHGVMYSMESPELRAKIDSTVKVRFGVGNAMQSSAVVKKGLSTKCVNETFGTSEGEVDLYDRLVNEFGVDDVVWQYRSDAYPWACDFYVKSRDMYIELNGTWTHGGHWFGSWSGDTEKLEKWRRRGTTYYRNAEAVWTGYDVQKRAMAAQGGLNYVVFWDDKVSDADLWLALGCPDGRDWEREYSWLPDRVLSYDLDWPTDLSLGQRGMNYIVRKAQWREFYKRELALWHQNYDKKWGTVQVRLYANRYKYLHKLPGELTDREILRGMNIAGFVDGYSTFDTAGMLEFLATYRPASVYDPCAGWGERMLTCAASGIGYLGVDINKALFAGYDEMISRYGLKNARVVNADSACFDATGLGHECVFTCPPYNNREIYTDAGAENLDFDKFLDWWDRVVDMSVGDETRVFAYQIDQAHKSAMNDVLAGRGWRLVRQIPVGVGKVSHMNRAQGVTSKKNFEEVQVFERAWRPGKARRPVRIIGRAFLPYGIRSWNPSTIYL